MWKLWAVVAAGLLALFVSPAARAEGNIRLLPDQTPTVNTSGLSGDVGTRTLQLTDEDEDDTLLVHRGWGYGWRGYGWGYRPFAYYRPYHYFRPYYYPSYYGLGFYRPYYYSNYYGLGYRPYYYPSYYGLGYYRPYYYSSYYYSPWSYSYPQTYYYSYACPISLDVTLGAPAAPAVMPPASNGSSYQPPQNQPSAPSATYPYDGGPRYPVPMPKPIPETKPAPAAPADGIRVSLPPQSVPKYIYPAYGETPAPTSFAEDRAVTVRK
jgi:hypothetical protein